MTSWWSAADAPLGDVNGFLQYGAVGLIAMLGVIFFRIAYKRESDRADRIELKYDRIMDKVIPVLMESGAVARQNMELIKDVNDKIVPILARLESQEWRGRHE